MKKVLTKSFTILNFLNFWTEEGVVQSFHHAVLKYANIIIYTWVAWSVIIKAFQTAESIDEFVDASLTASDFLCFYIKFLSFLIYSKDLSRLIKKLKSDFFSPETAEELRIVEKYKSLSRTTFRILATVYGFTQFILWLSAVLTIGLPYKAHEFCDIRKLSCYVVSVFLQTWFVIAGTTFLIAVDNLTLGCIILLTSHFDLIRHRVSKLSIDEKCFRNHVISYSIAKETVNLVQNFFSPMIFSSFGAVSLMLCMLVFSLSKESHKNYQPLRVSYRKP